MTSSLSLAVEFCSLSALLDEAEFEQLVCAILQRQGRKPFLTGLFHHYQDDKNIVAAHAAIHEIRRITHKRTSAPEPTQPQCRDINALPQELLGKVGSFLHHDDYFSYGTTCRSIFIGCSSPSTLMDLYAIDIPRCYYSQIGLGKYSQLRSLHININFFGQLNLRTSATVCRQLHTLHLSGNGVEECDIETFVSSNAIDCSSITDLTLSELGCEDDVVIDQSLLLLLSKFPNVRFIRLYGVKLRLPTMAEADREYLRRLCSHLVGVAVSHDAGLGKQLVQACAPNLNHLQLDDEIEFAAGINFPNLRELSLRWSFLLYRESDAMRMLNCQDDANKLQRIRLSCDYSGCPANPALFDKLLVGRTASVDIEILWTFEFMDDVCSNLSHSLSKIASSGIRSVRVALSFECDRDHLVSADGYVGILLNVLKLIDRFHSSHINEFIFVFQVTAASEDIMVDMDKWQDLWQEHASVDIIANMFHSEIYLDSGSLKVSIVSANCTMQCRNGPFVLHSWD